MTVIVRLKGEEARKNLEAKVEAAATRLTRTTKDLSVFELERKPPKWWEFHHPHQMFQPQLRVDVAKRHYDSLLAQLALFDQFPQQAEVILKEG